MQIFRNARSISKQLIKINLTKPTILIIWPLFVQKNKKLIIRLSPNKNHQLSAMTLQNVLTIATLKLLVQVISYDQFYKKKKRKRKVTWPIKKKIISVSTHSLSLSLSALKIELLAHFHWHCWKQKTKIHSFLEV